jgi:Ca-activated chloride channel homolog
MQFGNLNILIFLWLVPLLCLFYFWSFRKKDFLLTTFCPEKSVLPRLLHSVNRRRQILKAVLIIAGVSLAIIALSRPQWGFEWEEVQRRGAEIVVAVDVSQSMLARDVDTNRLERAKREVTDLVRMLQGDKIGLVAFAGSSFVECPLTLDYSAFSIFLDALSPDLIPAPGTALAEALRTSLTVFTKERNIAKAVIMITDGEDHEGNILQVVDEARKEGIKIFTIGIGSVEGAPIPLADPSGGFKKDNEGGWVLSRLDRVTLEKIALNTGGRYVHSMTGEMDLDAIYKEGIRQGMTVQELGNKKTKKWKERFQWPLLAAILCLVAEALMTGAYQKETG